MQKFFIAIFSCFFLFILWVIYLANTGQPSVFFELVRLIPYGDKIGHIVLFGFLTLFANVATSFRGVRIGKVHCYWGAIVVMAFVAVEELSQALIPTRTLDVVDFTADLVGIFAFTFISRWLERKYSRQGA